MAKRYWYNKVDKNYRTKESGSGGLVDLERVAGNDVVYFLRSLEENNERINVLIQTENFELKINSD